MTEFRRAIQQNWVKIIERLDIQDSLLLDSLYAGGVLSTSQIEALKAEPTSHDQTRRLLHIISRGPEENYQKFLHALQETNQEHIVCLLSEGSAAYTIAEDRMSHPQGDPGGGDMADGGSKVMTHVFDSEVSHRPGDEIVSQKQDDTDYKTMLRRHRVYLVEQIDLTNSYLWDMLLSESVISPVQYSHIKANFKTNYAQVGALLDYMEQRPVSDHEYFLRALGETGHSHVVETLCGQERDSTYGPGNVKEKISLWKVSGNTEDSDEFDYTDHDVDLYTGNREESGDDNVHKKLTESNVKPGEDKRLTSDVSDKLNAAEVKSLAELSRNEDNTHVWEALSDATNQTSQPGGHNSKDGSIGSDKPGAMDKTKHSRDVDSVDIINLAKSLGHIQLQSADISVQNDGAAKYSSISQSRPDHVQDNGRPKLGSAITKSDTVDDYNYKEPVDVVTGDPVRHAVNRTDLKQDSAVSSKRETATVRGGPGVQTDSTKIETDAARVTEAPPISDVARYLRSLSYQPESGKQQNAHSFNDSAMSLPIGLKRENVGQAFALGDAPRPYVPPFKPTLPNKSSHSPVSEKVFQGHIEDVPVPQGNKAGADGACDTIPIEDHRKIVNSLKENMKEMRKFIEGQETRFKGLTNLFTALHERNQLCLVQEQKLNEMHDSLQKSKRDNDHLQELVEHKSISISEALQIHKTQEGELSSVNTSGLDSLSSLFASPRLHRPDGSKVSVKEFLNELDSLYNDPLAVKQVFSNLLVELALLKKQIMSTKGEDGAQALLEKEEYEETIRQLQAEKQRVMFGMEQLRKMLINIKYGHTDNLVLMVYELQDKTSKLEKALSTQKELTEGYERELKHYKDENQSLKQQSLEKTPAPAVKPETEMVEEDTAVFQESLKLELDQAKSTLEEERRNFSAQMRKMTSDLQNQKQQLKELQQQLDTKNQYSDSSARVIADLREQNHKFQTSCILAQKHGVQLEEDLELVRIQLASAIEDNKALEKEKQVLEVKYKAELETKQSQLLRLAQEFQKMNEMLNQTKQQKQQLEAVVRALNMPFQQQRQQQQQHSMQQFNSLRPSWRASPRVEVVCADSGPATTPRSDDAAVKRICPRCQRSDFNSAKEYETHFNKCKNS